mmetsp:Transcript_136587/g.380717  ORF Transcript_136587/g.380717 Transcript_136587/m.380717 type:complete len:245 (+) Transcript_136587:1749-2483(+)
MSLRFLILSHWLCEPLGMIAESALPWASSLSSLPASMGNAESWFAGAVKSSSLGEVKSGRDVIRFESTHSSSSTGKVPTSTGSPRKKLPLRNSCSSSWSRLTSAGIDLSPLEMRTKAFIPWQSPTSRGRLRRKRHDEMRISTMPSMAKMTGGNAGISAGGQRSAASASRSSSKQRRTAGWRPKSCGLSLKSCCNSSAKPSLRLAPCRPLTPPAPPSVLGSTASLSVPAERVEPQRSTTSRTHCK